MTETSMPQTVVALADDAAELDACAPALRGLVATGRKVVLVWLHGQPGPRLRSLRARVELREEAPRGPRRRAQHLLARTTGRRSELLSALAADQRATRLVREAGGVLPLGDQASGGVRRVIGPDARVLGVEDLAEFDRLGNLWRLLERRLGEGPLRRSEVIALQKDLDRLDGGVPTGHQHLLLPVVQTLHQKGDYARALRLMKQVSAPGEDEVEAALRQGWRTLVQMSAAPQRTHDLQPVVGQLMAVADRAVAGSETELAVEVTTLALNLLFHRELHADGLSSPLVDDPDAFLSVWRGSEVARLLASPTPRRPVHRRATGAGEHQQRPTVVVVPGTYSQFATPAVTALESTARVRVVDVTTSPRLRGMGTRAELVAARLRQALGLGGDVLDHVLMEEMEAADVLFVDWADRGGFAALLAVPEGLPVTLRIHSMDALSPWIHLLDWSRVDDLVVVSEHMRLLLQRQLGERLAGTGTRVHVVPNLLDRSRIPEHKTDGHRRRLLMVGWAQRVKDPLWALEVLSTLRAEDPSWRLRLVGPDFGGSAAVSERAYAEEFRRRLLRDDVRDAVELVGRTRHLAPHLAASGFVLSTSRRESFGLGLVEGAASGAVPVVRDWPMFAPLGGARRMFPDDWVVADVQGAVDRIRANAEEPAWSQASEETRREVADRFEDGSSGERLRQIILKDQVAQPAGTAQP